MAKFFSQLPNLQATRVDDWYSTGEDYLISFKKLFFEQREYLQEDSFSQLDLKNIPDPSLLKSSTASAKLLISHIIKGNKILVIGDYDVDGVSSATLIYRFLTKIGYKNFHIFLPSRFTHGYGLSATTRKDILAEEPNIIITVDNGINALAEEEFYNSINIDLIVTDHHEATPGMTPLKYVINPKQPGCSYPFKMLSGSGVAFLFLIELRRQLRNINYWLDNDGPNLAQDLDLVTFGTIADQTPLIGVNRIMVNYGLSLINKCIVSGEPHKYIKVLAQSLDVSEINTEIVTYNIAPLINAAGRMEHAKVAFNFITASGDDLINEKLAYLKKLNQQRKRVQQGMISDAYGLLQNGPANNAIVIFKDTFHEGLTGIVANALVNEYNVPAIVLAPTNEDSWKGSCRSPDGISLLPLLEASSDYLTKFGGHQQAAGITVEQNSIEMFSKAFSLAYDNLAPSTKTINQETVFELLPWMINYKLFNLVAEFEPYGMGHKRPIFMLRSQNLSNPSYKKNNMLRWRLNNYTDLIYLGSVKQNIEVGRWDVCGYLKKRLFNRTIYLQLNITEFIESEE